MLVVLWCWARRAAALRGPSAPRTDEKPLTATTRRASVAATLLTVASTSFMGTTPLTPRTARAIRPPEFVNRQPGFSQTASGLQWRDATVGTGREAEAGDRVVYEWEGYTIGYFGRPFEAKKRAKGGDFADDRDFDRFVVGRGDVVPAVDEGVRGMREGGVRQLVFGPDLGYPMLGDEMLGNMDDPSHDRVGPKPGSFSGMRALNFVLSSKGDTLDKTLLINLKLVRVDKPGGAKKF